MSDSFSGQPTDAVNPTIPNRPLFAAGHEPEPVVPTPEVDSAIFPTDALGFDVPVDAPEPGPEVLDLPQEQEIGQFSLNALKKYANPVTAAKAYGRFVKRTFKRFGWAEVNGTATALLGAHFANKYGYNALATSVAGAQAENVGFYGTTLSQRYRELRKNEKSPYTRTEAAKETLNYLVGAFAIAEAIDAPVRPFFMDVAQHAAESVPTVLAVGVGKFAADNVYYGVVDPLVKRHYKKAEKRKMRKLEAEANANQSQDI